MSKSKITGREFIGSIAATGALAGFDFGRDNKIDRYALVSRHNQRSGVSKGRLMERSS